MTAAYTVSRSQAIAATPEQIYPHLIDFHRWIAWSPWEKVDPSMRRTYSGPERGVGAAYAWEGNRKAGSGTMRVTGVDEPTRVDVDLHFDKPFPADNDIRFDLQPEPAGGTLVTWTMTGQHTGIMRVLGRVMSMDKLVGKDFERGLSQLAAVVESS